MKTKPAFKNSNNNLQLFCQPWQLNSEVTAFEVPGRCSIASQAVTDNSYQNFL